MAVFRLLIRKASQPPVVPAISAVWVASEGLCQSLCGYSAYISRYRRVREFHPRLIVTGAGFYRGRWRKTFDLHLRSGFWLKIIYQNKSMLTNGPDVNIVALGIHAFKPRRVFSISARFHSRFIIWPVFWSRIPISNRSVPKALICLWRATAVRSERVSDVLPLPAGRAVSDS